MDDRKVTVRSNLDQCEIGLRIVVDQLCDGCCAVGQGHFNSSDVVYNVVIRDDVADKLEDLQEQEATSANLEKSLREVTSALTSIEAGTYGICVVCGSEIEADRLEANPSAATCKTHLPSEESSIPSRRWCI